MSEYQRRSFLKQGLAAGAVGVAMPTLTSLKLFTFHSTSAISEFSYDGGDLVELDYTLDDLLLKRAGSFEAYANPVGLFAGAATLLTLGAAAITVLEWFGVRSPFTSTPSFRDARQCEGCYRNAQRDLATRGVRYHTDVLRPTRTADVSTMIASTTPGSDTRNVVQVTTQHGSTRAVAQTGTDPGVLIGTFNALREIYPAEDRFAPYAVTAIDKRTTQLPDGATAMRYETPVHTVVHDSRVRGRYTGGVAYIHRKGDRSNPNNQYWMGFYV